MREREREREKDLPFLHDGWSVRAHSPVPWLWSSLRICGECKGREIATLSVGRNSKVMPFRIVTRGNKEADSLLGIWLFSPGKKA